MFDDVPGLFLAAGSSRGACAVLQLSLIHISCEKSSEHAVFYHSMNPKVYAMKLTPGISPGILQAVFDEYDCIVVESFGVGGIPDSIIEDFCSLMKRYREGSKVIIMTTQVTYEGSNLATYEVGKRIKGKFPYLEAYDIDVYKRQPVGLCGHYEERSEDGYIA